MGKRRGTEVPLEPEGSRLPSVQNNTHAKVAHLGDACFEHFHPLEEFERSIWVGEQFHLYFR